MGRTRSFDEGAVVALAANQFRTTGYEATSLDDLLRVTGLHRGSLYQAFGSKRGVFLAAVKQAVAGELNEAAMDLILVALADVAPADDAVRELVAQRLAGVDGAAVILGERLLARALIDWNTEPIEGD